MTTLDKSKLAKEPCECIAWARAGLDPYKIKTRDGAPLVTNHHEKCPHYNDSLMDVWVVTDGSSRCFVDNEQDAIDTCDHEGEEYNTISKVKMHREVFENLPEFEGF